MGLRPGYARPGRRARVGTHWSGSVSITAYTSPEVRDRVRVVGDAVGMTTSEIVRDALELWLRADGHEVHVGTAFKATRDQRRERKGVRL